MSKVWLITGSAAGLGRSITEAALAAGHRVVATARSPQRLQSLAEQYPGRLLPVELDVTDPVAAASAVNAGTEAFGGIDVLVNNAGYGHLVPFEQKTEADFRAEIETNFFGVVNVTRAVLPQMRTRRAGYIFTISSVGGRMGTPGMSAYQSAKWAVGGFTDVLALETKPLGIQVCSIEPGGIRTHWAERASRDMPAGMPDYQSTVGVVQEFLRQYIGNENSSPEKIAQVILALSERKDVPVRLLLGSDAVQLCGEVEEQRRQEGERWRQVGLFTDHAGNLPLQLPE